MIKVLVLGPSFVFKGGVTNYLELLIKNLEKDDFLVKYFPHGVTPSKLKNIFIPFVVLFQLIKLIRILNKFQPDVVHINPSLALGAIIRDFIFLSVVRVNRYPVLLFVHGWHEIISSRFEKKGFWKKIFKNLFNKADKIVVLADQFKEKLVNLGINREKIFVTSTMVESDRYFPHDKKFLKPYKILTCTDMIREKGVFELLEAAPKVLKKTPDSKFIFVGDGKDLVELKQKTKKMNLEKNFVFTGYISGEEKINIFKNAHIFVFPSYTEGFPTVILEAMASGAALIFTPVGGLADTMMDGKNGYIVKSMPPNPEEIAKKIIQLVENPRLMIKMSENNLIEAKEKFDAKILSEEIRKIYEQIFCQY